MMEYQKAQRGLARVHKSPWVWVAIQDDRYSGAGVPEVNDAFVVSIMFMALEGLSDVTARPKLIGAGSPWAKDV
jgi:hypothetical protein